MVVLACIAVSGCGEWRTYSTTTHPSPMKPEGFSGFHPGGSVGLLEPQVIVDADDFTDIPHEAALRLQKSLMASGIFTKVYLPEEVDFAPKDLPLLRIRLAERAERHKGVLMLQCFVVVLTAGLSFNWAEWATTATDDWDVEIESSGRRWSVGLHWAGRCDMGLNSLRAQGPPEGTLMRRAEKALTASMIQLLREDP